MKSRRQKGEKYSFSGRSLAELDSLHSQIERKMVDPNDCDDKRWVRRWLTRIAREIAKKSKGLEAKEASLR